MPRVYLRALAEQPHRLGRYLRDQLVGLHSSRRGSYQLVYRIDNDTQRLDIAHCGDGYRRLFLY